jgi:hypothetical protein
MKISVIGILLGDYVSVYFFQFRAYESDFLVRQ